MPGPLSGVRVLDFGRAAVGPVSAQYLGFLGADVVKIEPPEGDPVRNVATFKRGMGTTFLGNNLNKRGIMLDLKKPDDMAVAHRLIQWTDIVIENFRSGEGMERLGLGYSALAELNPRVIYLSSGAYGNAGPMQDGETGTIEIERIGRMTVRVEDPQKRRWPVGIDRGVGKAVRQWKLTGVRPNPDEMFQTKQSA